ncbi:MAG TPA: DNA polymerase III subunit beta [Candidatus Paceibacterota bacterium]
MKLECLKERVRDAVAQAEKITGKHLTLPVLKCVLLEAKNNTLIVRATNLDLGVEFFIPAKVEKVGVNAVSGVVLYNFLQNLQNEKTVSFESKEGILLLEARHNVASIKTAPHEDFPTIPKVETGKLIKMHSNDLLQGLKAVWYSSATTSMKPELSSIYIYSDDVGFVFVATDSFRLAEKRIKQKKSMEVSGILIPHKNIPEIMKILESINGDVDVSLDRTQIAIIHEGVYLTSRVIDGAFPDYKQIIPKDFKTEVVLLKQDLINALKLTNVFSDNFNQVHFKINPTLKLFEISTKNMDIGENRNFVEAAISGEPLEINFNYKYIVDCFQSLTTDSLSLKFNGLARPMVIEGIGDKTFLYLVMPMNK